MEYVILSSQGPCVKSLGEEVVEVKSNPLLHAYVQEMRPNYEVSYFLLDKKRHVVDRRAVMYLEHLYKSVGWASERNDLGGTDNEDSDQEQDTHVKKTSMTQTSGSLVDPSSTGRLATRTI